MNTHTHAPLHTLIAIPVRYQFLIEMSVCEQSNRNNVTRNAKISVGGDQIEVLNCYENIDSNCFFSKLRKVKQLGGTTTRW